MQAGYIEPYSGIFCHWCNLSRYDSSGKYGLENSLTTYLHPPLIDMIINSFTGCGFRCVTVNNGAIVVIYKIAIFTKIKMEKKILFYGVPFNLS